MTDDELKAIEARANAATPGEWQVGPEIPLAKGREGLMHINAGDYGEVARLLSYLQDAELAGRWRADAQFIAHAREDIPKLIAEIRRLREERDLERRKWETLALAERLHNE